MFTPFYNESLRKLVIAFGSLFNNVKVTRDNSDVIRVPLAYGAKEKFIRRIEEASSITDDSRDVGITLVSPVALAIAPSANANQLRVLRASVRP